MTVPTEAELLLIRQWKREWRAPFLARPLPQTAPDPLSAAESPCVRQTVSFFDLPAEIRNRIYELAMPSKEDGALLVASPAWDDQMRSAVQPGITRASKQTRQESLKMFYANNELRAYVENLDFRGVIRWARFVTSPLYFKVHVFMLHKMSCFAGLERFAHAWRNVDFDRFHLVIHSDFMEPEIMISGVTRAMGGRQQCEVIVQAIEAAETGSVDSTLRIRLNARGADLGCHCNPRHSHGLTCGKATRVYY